MARDLAIPALGPLGVLHHWRQGRALGVGAAGEQSEVRCGYSLFPLPPSALPVLRRRLLQDQSEPHGPPLEGDFHGSHERAGLRWRLEVYLAHARQRDPCRVHHKKDLDEVGGTGRGPEGSRWGSISDVTGHAWQQPQQPSDAFARHFGAAARRAPCQPEQPHGRQHCEASAADHQHQRPCGAHRSVSAAYLLADQRGQPGSSFLRRRRQLGAHARSGPGDQGADWPVGGPGCGHDPRRRAVGPSQR
mmetsp:Transcript_90924/g.190132  ORF Transcript_90924/g.190132 Transcript_90924/m.190132 type:complete len:247 (-) Transcript_90924:443-1183(-)